MTHVTIYTDGACSGNPGPGGWCAILRWNKHERMLSGGEPHTTNNRVELIAIIKGLAALKYPCRVTVFTDSQYVIGVMSLGWKRKANHDLLHELDALCATHKVTFEYVRGHAGHPLNERCDRLACQERDKAKASVADFTGTQCAACGDLASNGVFCQHCRGLLSDRELNQAWQEHCLPSGYEQPSEAVADMSPIGSW